MPELGEVAYYARQWEPGRNRPIRRVLTHPKVRVFRGLDVAWLEITLTGTRLRSIHTHGKQMLFGFSGGRLEQRTSAWLGIHLGMAGSLAFHEGPYAPAKHDHLVLRLSGQDALVFTDTRHFGRIRLATGKALPTWWTALPPQVQDDTFTRDRLKAVLRRRQGSPVKAVLLRQEHFPGIGNWMADEILWRARIHPATKAGNLSARKVTALYEAAKEVCDDALRVIAPDWPDPLPENWLFNHRWREGGRCPRTGRPLVRETIAGRTTCYCPTVQRLPRRTA
ncbi:MAG: Fpg/Nei family DNA glycosylase [Opitutales bacterium]